MAHFWHWEGDEESEGRNGDQLVPDLSQMTRGEVLKVGLRYLNNLRGKETGIPFSFINGLRTSLPMQQI